MAHKTIRILILLFLTFAQTGKAQIFTTDVGDVQFLSDAPLEMIKGTTDALSGKIDFAERTVDFYVDLETIDTGIKLRNEHLRENFLRTSKYPFAEFFGEFDKSIDVKTMIQAAVRDTQNVDVVGSFTVNGVTRPVKIPGKVFVKNNKVHIQAAWELKLEDYQIPIPQILAYKISEVQYITIKATLERTK